jgi:misacylated tRNA(Ala) deacylase
MTEFLFRDDAYLAEARAFVTAVSEAGFELDRTVFYAASGGQPGDTGRLLADGAELTVTGAIHPDGDRTHIVHLLAPGTPLPAPGAEVTAALDWERRHVHMRMHSALHLLSVVLPYGVTGGAIGADKGRLDFDMPEPPEDLAEVEARAAVMAWDPGSGGRKMTSPRGGVKGISVTADISERDGRPPPPAPRGLASAREGC